MTKVKIDGVDVDLIYDPARGGWFAQRFPGCSVSVVCYRTKLELVNALGTGSHEWDVD